MPVIAGAKVAVGVVKEPRYEPNPKLLNMGGWRFIEQADSSGEEKRAGMDVGLKKRGRCRTTEDKIKRNQKLLRTGELKGRID